MKGFAVGDVHCVFLLCNISVIEWGNSTPKTMLYAELTFDDGAKERQVFDTYEDAFSFARERTTKHVCE